MSATKLSAQFPTCDSSEAIPEIAPADAHADREWFANHPERRFRARAGTAGTWLVRRQQPGGGDSEIYLRAFTSSISVSSNAGDRELAAHWFQAAHPRWSPEACRTRAKKALRRVQR